jgi:hypothetical protein
MEATPERPAPFDAAYVCGECGARLPTADASDRHRSLVHLRAVSVDPEPAASPAPGRRSRRDTSRGSVDRSPPAPPTLRDVTIY